MSKKIQLNEKLITLNEAAALLRCHRSTVERLLKTNKIPYLRIQRKYLIPEARLFAALTEVKE